MAEKLPPSDSAAIGGQINADDTLAYHKASRMVLVTEHGVGDLAGAIAAGEVEPIAPAHAVAPAVAQGGSATVPGGSNP